MHGLMVDQLTSSEKVSQGALVALENSVGRSKTAPHNEYRDSGNILTDEIIYGSAIS